MEHHLFVVPLGFLIRLGLIFLDASLYLLIGFLTAGALRAMAGPGRVRGLFGTGRWGGPVRAWAAATVLLPVCSLGVLPVIRELRRSGVGRPAILTFALAAPMLNPISLIYGVSYLGPWLLGILIAGTAFVSIGAGVAWGYLIPEDPVAAPPVDDRRVPAIGLRRPAAAAAFAARESVGPACLDVAAGMVLAALLAATLSAPDLAGVMFAGDRMAIPRMLLLAPLSYLTPDQSVTMIPEMLKFRQSAGALFLLVALGGGMTAGHLAWIARAYGPRSAALWLAMVGGLALAGAYAIEWGVPAVGTANEDNDHFGVLANPLENVRRLPEVGGAVARIVQGIPALRWATAGALVALMVLGFLLRSQGDDWAFETSPMAAGTGAAAWDRALSPRWAGAAASAGLIAVAVAGLYAYFPGPEEGLRDMQIIKADLFGELGAAEIETPVHHLDLWERQAAKLATGAFIRLAPAGPEARFADEDLRSGLRAVRRAVEGRRPEEARKLFPRLDKAMSRCRTAYGIGGTRRR